LTPFSIADEHDLFEQIQDGVMAFCHSNVVPPLHPHEQRVIQLAHEMYHRLLTFIDLGMLVKYDSNIGLAGYNSNVTPLCSYDSERVMDFIHTDVWRMQYKCVIFVEDFEFLIEPSRDKIQMRLNYGYELID
jgi:hypothetical protein